MDKQKPITLPDLRGKMTNKQLQKSTEKEDEMAYFSRLQKFMEIQNAEVEKEKLQEHPIVKDCKYLPISHMEMALDEIFFGQWSTENFRWQVVSNEVIGSMDLLVFHPLTKQWIRRTGATAIQIMVDSIPEQQRKTMQKQEINAWAVDINNKKPGALTNGGFSKLKAECFKNACLSLGKYFGRDVNREHTASDYLGTIKDPDERKTELRSRISEELLHNQDSEYVQNITQLIIDAEEAGKNTIEFYKSIILKLKPNGSND